MALNDDRNYGFEYDVSADDESKFRPDSGIEPDCGTHYQAIESGDNVTDNGGLSSSGNSISSNGSSVAGNNAIKKIEDPLNEPIVRSSLQKIQISSSQLINMSVKDLNKLLSSFPAYVVSKLKNCRRTLKNRGYAKNCRIRRVAAKNELELANMKLVIENRELRQRNKSLLEQLNQLNANNQNSSAIGSALSSGISSIAPTGDIHHQQRQQQITHTNCGASNATNGSQTIVNYSHPAQDQYTNLPYSTNLSDGNYSRLSEPDLDYIVETINSTDNPTFACDWQPTRSSCYY